MQKIKQRGAVSLFVVVFTALLVTIVTVSFITLMLKSQQQASDNDLSQSAYDSAVAGVEDAKRALVTWKQCETGRVAPTVNCATLNAALSSNACDTLAQAGLVALDPVTKDVKIQQSSGDTAYNQAYTCVKITTNTDTVEGTLAQNQTQTVQLKGVSAFDTVKISWFQSKDMASGMSAQLPSAAPNNLALGSLPPNGVRWTANTPALLRTQFMQTGSSFSLSDLDGESNPADKSDANTVFMYPASTGTPVALRDIDARRVAAKSPVLAQCTTSSLVGGQYACSTTLRLPEPITGSANDRGLALLRLTALYNKASFKIELLNGASPVLFNGVSPMVDSTGRANDSFRRVQARIQLDGSPFLTPEAAIDIDGNLCKNFLVTDSSYQATGSCTP